MVVAAQQTYRHFDIGEWTFPTSSSCNVSAEVNDGIRSALRGLTTVGSRGGTVRNRRGIDETRVVYVQGAVAPVRVRGPTLCPLSKTVGHVMHSRSMAVRVQPTMMTIV